MPFLKVLAILAVVASSVSAVFGTLITRSLPAPRRRLYSSIHISSGIVLCVVSALLAFWVLTE